MLFRELRRVATIVHDEGEQTAARRSILIEVVEEDPRTVPAMAEARHISRQAVQGLVDALAKDGLVDRSVNPAHKRSWLWGATAAGAAKVASMRARERERLGGISGVPEAERIEAACAVMAEVEAALAAIVMEDPP